MGLAILPPRIDRDIHELSKVLQGIETVDFVEKTMENHYSWFLSITDGVDKTMSETEAVKFLQQAVADRFSEVLECAGVYKSDEAGMASFEKFIVSTGAELI